MFCRVKLISCSQSRGFNSPVKPGSCHDSTWMDKTSLWFLFFRTSLVGPNLRQSPRDQLLCFLVSSEQKTQV